jgi:hypothetical protein
VTWVERCPHYAPGQLAVESRTKPVAVIFRRDVEGRVCVYHAWLVPWMPELSPLLPWNGYWRRHGASGLPRFPTSPGLVQAL